MVAEEMFETDIPFAHLTTLFAISMYPGLSGRALGRESFLNPQSMNETLAWLQRHGYIQRRQSPQHPNALVAELTASGRAVIERIMPRSGKVERALTGDLSPQEVEALRALLVKARDGMRRRLGMDDEPANGESRFASTRASQR